MDLVRFAPHDLFHAMVSISIAYELSTRKTEDLRDGDLDPMRSSTRAWTSHSARFPGHNVSVWTSLTARREPRHFTCFRAHARGRIRPPNSSCRSKKRFAIYCRSPRVPALGWYQRSQPGPRCRSRCESSVDWASGSRRAQSADDGLRVPLDDGQVGTDGDLRAPPALLPVLQRAHVESE